MIHFVSQLLETMHTGRWFVFEIYVMFVWTCMLPRMVFAGMFYAFRNKPTWIERYPDVKHAAVVVLTIYEENLEILEESMRKVKASLDVGTSRYFFGAIIDGYNKDPIAAAAQAEIARKYADVVLATNARNKRKNIRAILRDARQRGRIERITILLDSDTIPVSPNDSTVARLLAPFSDPRIGGATTAQLIHNPRTWIQKISFWNEDARLNSSMAACTYFGQVLCLPGRMYAALTELLEPRLDEFVNDYFSYFGFFRRLCIAGDDRATTNFVLQAGYRTILVPDACVVTTAPETFPKTQGMWARWGRSSQLNTIRSPWLIKYPFAFFVAWGDILMAPLTVYIVAVHWPLTFWYGHSTTPLLQAVSYAIIGMMMTMVIRQFPHLWKYPKSWWMLPVFVIVMTYAQFIRVYSLLTLYKISTWGGARSGGSATNAADDRAWVIYEAP